MSVQAILAPVFVQVALTFALLVWLGIVRKRVLDDGAVNAAEIAQDTQKWPDDAKPAAAAFRNQFELPVLFYVVCTLALITRQATTLFVVLAWVFVVSRLVHAYVHLTYNRLTHRGFVFLIGCLALMLMWIMLAIGVLTA